MEGDSQGNTLISRGFRLFASLVNAFWQGGGLARRSDFTERNAAMKDGQRPGSS